MAKFPALSSSHNSHCIQKLDSLCHIQTFVHGLCSQFNQSYSVISLVACAKSCEKYYKLQFLEDLIKMSHDLEWESVENEIP